MFMEALKARVTRGSRVLDIGAGTGIWAIAAAKLGADRVVAVDMDELLVGVIRMLADEHGVGDRVEAVCARSFDLDLDRDFDVVVSETIGYLGYDERIVEVMSDARKRFLRDGGNIIPETVALYAAPGSLKVRTETVPAGTDFEFDAFSRLSLNSPRVLKRSRDITLSARPALLVSTDLRRTETMPSLRDLRAAWDLHPSADVNCVIVWVRSRLAPRVTLNTRRTTSWLPTVYRIAPPNRPVERMEFSLSLTAESNFWTATFVGGDRRESRSYSPELGATEMIAAARGHGVINEHGRIVVADPEQPPVVLGLRKVLAEDDDFLRRLYRTTRADEVAAFGWSEAEQDSFIKMQFEMREASYAMQYPAAEHSVVLVDGVQAGRIIVDRSGDVTSLTDIALLPEFRGRGFASRLIGGLQKETNAIVLSVDKENTAAMRLYEKHGFVVTGETEFTFAMRWADGSARYE